MATEYQERMEVMAADVQAIKDEALQLGFDSVGICPADTPPHLEAYRAWIDKGYHGTMTYLAEHAALKEGPESILPGARSVIAVALNYYQPTTPTQGEPRIARYALGRDYHKVLRSKLRKLAGFIETRYPDARSRACVDSAPIMERDYALLAGIGWYGKNTMLIDSRRGSWFFIGLLLTTLELEPDLPAIGGCGTCTRCIEACPTGAIVFEDGRWQVDARRCISYLTIEHEGEHGLDTAGWTFGCDVCQEVCPFNQPRPSQPLRSATTREPDFLARRSWPGLRELAQIRPDEWDRLTQGSPVRRAGLVGLCRNASLNLMREPEPADSVL